MGTWNLKPAPGLPALWNLKLKNNTYMMKEKRLYQSPPTRRDEVELEDGFCGSITNDAGLGQTVESASQGFEEVSVSDGFDTNTDGTIKWD